MAHTIVVEHTPTINSDVVARLEHIEVQLRTVAAELAQIARLTGSDEFTESELEFARKVAAGEEVGFDDLLASLYPDC